MKIEFSWGLVNFIVGIGFMVLSTKYGETIKGTQLLIFGCFYVTWGILGLNQK